MHVEVIRAGPEQEPVIANLLQLYAHDFSEFFDLVLEPDGRFRYDELPLYWRDPNRYPFLVIVDGHLAGFILIKQESEISGAQAVYDMAEFFIARRYRRHGVGTEAALKVWRQFPGLWEVRAMHVNDSATLFWAYAIKAFTCRTTESTPVAKNGKRWNVFSFESPHAF